MALINEDELLSPISDEAPSGENMEYEAVFQDMETAAQGSPEVQYGDTIAEAQEPEWRDVKNSALAVLSQSKDLRAAIYLTQALAHTDGFVGLSEGLDFTRRLVETFWADFHPQLDPDDGDPMERVNALAPLCDQDAMLHSLREAPLVSSRAVGRFGLRDYEIANGDLRVPSADPEKMPKMDLIDAAFLDCELEELQQTAEAVKTATDSVVALEQYVTEQVGASQAISLNDLVHQLKEADKILTDRLERRGVSTGEAEETPEGEGGEAVAGVSAAPQQFQAGVISSRDDVKKAIDKIVEYYDRSEPSSPVPQMLKRVKSLVDMSFLEILQDIAPDAMTQATTVIGKDESAEQQESSGW